MKRLLTIAAATLLAGSAMAQGAPGWDRNAFWRGAPESPRERIAFLQDRINRGAADGSLDRREADHAQRDLDGIRRWSMRLHMRDGGHLSNTDRDALQARLDDLSHRLHWMRHNGW
jgi:hypothetical protein